MSASGGGTRSPSVCVRYRDESPPAKRRRDDRGWTAVIYVRDKSVILPGDAAKCIKAAVGVHCPQCLFILVKTSKDDVNFFHSAAVRRVEG